MGVNTKDTQLFLELQQPHESADAVNAAVQAFLEDVGEARKKHRISEVLTCAFVRYITSDGEEADAMVPHFYGDQLHAESVSAYALGRYAERRQESIAKLMTSGVQRAKGKK